MLAEDQVEIVSKIVYDKLAHVFDWASLAQMAAEEALGSIGGFQVPVIQMNLPDAPALGETKSPSVNDVPTSGVSISPVQVEYQQTGQVQFVKPPELPPLQYGNAVAPLPAPTDAVPTPPTLYPQVAIPVVPDQPDLFNPTEPVLTNASPPALLYVDVPDFTFPFLPPFPAPFPAYVVPSPIAPVQPTVPYPPALDNALRDQLLAMLKGDSGALDDVREAMIDRLVETADTEAQTAIDAAFTSAAARNFSIPNGTLVDGVNDIRVATSLKIREGMSEINNRLAKEAMANYQTGMELALVLEKAYISFYLEYAHQILAAEKLNVQVQVELFNATVALFNAQQSARAIHASAWKAQVEGIIAGMGSYTTAVEGAIAETAENEQRVQMYAADAGLVRARTEVYTATTRKELAAIELYKSEVNGVRAQAEIVNANVESYRAAVSAYAAAVGGTSAVIESFSHETQAKSSQVGVYTSNAKAYASYVQEGVRRANTWKVFADTQNDVLRANMQSYQAAAEANQSFVRAQTAAIGAEAEIAQARSSAYAVGIQAVKVYNRAEMDNVAAAQQFAMVAAENLTRAQTLASIAQAETDRINAGALAAQTGALAGLAQGAMSVMHVSAGAEGSGSMDARASWQEGTSLNWGGSNTYAETHEERIST